jgi:hypothetical protein
MVKDLLDMVDQSCHPSELVPVLEVDFQETLGYQQQLQELELAVYTRVKCIPKDRHGMMVAHTDVPVWMPQTDNTNVPTDVSNTRTFPHNVNFNKTPMTTVVRHPNAISLNLSPPCCLSSHRPPPRQEQLSVNIKATITDKERVGTMDVA